MSILHISHQVPEAHAFSIPAHRQLPFKLSRNRADLAPRLQMPRLTIAQTSGQVPGGEWWAKQFRLSRTPYSAEMSSPVLFAFISAAAPCGASIVNMTTVSISYISVLPFPTAATILITPFLQKCLFTEALLWSKLHAMTRKVTQWRKNYTIYGT